LTTAKKMTSRVTRWVCEKLAQNVAHSVFCRN
jgi:hypothetical protein